MVHLLKWFKTPCILDSRIEKKKKTEHARPFISIFTAFLIIIIKKSILNQPCSPLLCLLKAAGAAAGKLRFLGGTGDGGSQQLKRGGDEEKEGWVMHSGVVFFLKQPKGDAMVGLAGTPAKSAFPWESHRCAGMLSQLLGWAARWGRAAVAQQEGLLLGQDSARKVVLFFFFLKRKKKYTWTHHCYLKFLLKKKTLKAVSAPENAKHWCAPKFSRQLWSQWRCCPTHTLHYCSIGVGHFHWSLLVKVGAGNTNLWVSKLRKVGLLVWRVHHEDDSICRALAETWPDRTSVSQQPVLFERAKSCWFRRGHPAGVLGSIPGMGMGWGPLFLTGRQVKKHLEEHGKGGIQELGHSCSNRDVYNTFHYRPQPQERSV